MSGKNEVAKVEEKNTEVVKSENGVINYDLAGNLPNISKDFDALPIDLMSDYWTPEQVGESKRVFFVKFGNRKVLVPDTGELIDLECAFFIEQSENGDLIQISNGSKRLVGALMSAEMKKGTPLIIIYKGKRRNRTGPYSSDDWSVKPLIIKA